MRWRQVVAAGGAGTLLLAGYAATALLVVANRAEGGVNLYALLFATVFLVIGLVAAALAALRPRNAIGWGLLSVGLAMMVAMLGEAYAVHTFAGGGGNTRLATWAVWTANWAPQPAVAFVATLLPLLFPDGRLPSRRWRPVAWLVGALIVAVTYSSAARRSFALPISTGEEILVTSPVALPTVAGLADFFAGLGFGLLVVLQICSVASLVGRFRRGSAGERAQIKWLALSLSVLAAWFVVQTGLTALTGINVGETPLAAVVIAVILISIPAAIAIAILKYRLYDIDVVINRTLVYGSLTAVLVGAYALGVLVFRTLLDPVTGDNDVAIAASTLAVAALFGPARRRIQGAIDRRFYRSRYDAQQTLETFAARLRDEVDLDVVSADVVGVLVQTLEPRHASVILFGGDRT